MKLNISWEQIQADTLALADKITEANLIRPHTRLVCLSRGGLFVGGILSYALNLKKVHVVSIESYESDTPGSNSEVKLINPFLSDLPDNMDSCHYLVVDDINDTSETFRAVSDEMNKRNFTDWNFATVYHKPRETNDVPDFYGKEIPPEEWIVFPWDCLR